jgi:RHS repeat-associated protein
VDLLNLVHEVQLGGDHPLVERSYLFTDNREVVPIAQKEGAGASPWIHYVGDLNETPEELVDASGRLVGRMDRSTFGAATPAPGSRVTTPFRAPGQLADPETGLYYNRCRYYDPETGHFISPDPIGLAGGENLYAPGPNPIGWYDPMGWDPHSMDASATDANNNPIPLGRDGADGKYGSGQDSGYPKDLQSQAKCHTEQKFLSDLAAAKASGANLDGGKANCTGALPPCPNCHRAMRAFADKNGMTLTYKWGTPQQAITYGPGALPKGKGADARALVGAGTATSQGAYAATAVDPSARPNGYQYNDWKSATGTYSDVK